MLAFLTALFGAPSAIEKLLSRVDLLEQKLASYEKEKELAAIDQAVKESENALTSEDIKKAAHSASDVTSHL